MHAAIIALAAAIIINGIRVFSELLFVNPHQVRVFNRLMKEWRQKAQEAIKRGDPKQMERIKREKAKIDSLTMAVSKMRFKSMMTTLTASLLVFFVAIQSLSESLILVPLLGEITAVWFLILCSFAWSSIFSIILKLKGYE
ncbi:MAG: EMC3/TMCO1 family protein [Crenarchaeota archaeon]|nr:EMC3/TMCO1 family protein [Thermoproteota archaeon]MCR8453488.1 EMC3/TMCO1 family protein [Thermoproteota archaeon]MCR8454867.1 EMC3/TMCO1 family protein [Thermoproteota archaeon]MCR8462753.1 EMC3/TMCO1 family protein [Thermoproteota archaeon]MCR8471087.1 EMC3/TMCO1 family protein [Thermoproteota archaeon]